MYTFSVTPEFLVVIVAGLLALAFDYFPKLAEWYDAKDVTAKRQLMALLVIGSTVAIFVGQCFGLFATNLICTIKGGFDALYIIFLTITVNQGVHGLLKPSAAFKAHMFAKA